MHFVVTVAVAVAVVFVVIGGAVAVLLLMMWLIHIACLHCFQACSITLLVLFWIRAEWWKKTIHFAWRNLEKLFLDKSNQFNSSTIYLDYKSKILRVGSYWSINEDQCRRLRQVAFQIPYFTWIIFFLLQFK